ncbi:hypothetical protein A2966_04700 [Candidatus Roizmanbacteria bacterium RIFCSPLOWO2_01_FULL_41_22]|uniref:HEPN domain-containing protein n=2 Tax=Candidatus Roizmaniibacteriota TaxID=1752723 RepID=A0A1F7JR16_9BACT|nr:MAG: hypothetical protein A2966_04700 [Candidatus Roizmanbacteria bacterium RIFCSPLOWO2_01_FULL_41_22]OGK58049.1 MAG: hypothetical protein A3H86_00905 [Candidatus Roizmanbacteria bacterium RIFCSPLOWO2_02_FULL_41_9]
MTCFDWKGYITLAKRLAKNITDSSKRSSVSRAYYGVYCLSRNYAISQGLANTRSSRMHRDVATFYNQRAETRIIATYLGRLRDNRNKCDYDDSVSNLNNIVILSLQQADEIVKNLPT